MAEGSVADAANGGREKVVLKGLAKKWESVEIVRTRIRDNRRLFISSTKGNFDPACHCREASLNKEVLLPLLYILKQFRNEDGSTMLFKIASIEREMLG